MGTVVEQLPFHFDVGGVSVFQKSDPATGDELRHIGGMITTLKQDRAGQVALQDGLDFSIFKQEGFFIDEHDGSAGAVVGIPHADSLRFFKKGAKLPNDKPAPNEGWWVSGSLLRNKAGDRIWDVAKSLDGTGRSLGFSVDGKILLTKDNKRTIARAQVHDVAITRHAMNTDASLSVLAKAVQAAELGVDPALLRKALSAAGAGTDVPTGPVSESDGGGRVLTPEDLGNHNPKKKRSRAATRSDLAKALLDRWPWAPAHQVGRLVDALWR